MAAEEYDNAVESLTVPGLSFLNFQDGPNHRSIERFTLL
jgi:hypothetical protein